MLIKKRIDDDVLADALEGASIPQRLRALLNEEFSDEQTAKAALEAYRKEMPTGGDDDLIVDELKEICKDLKWSKSKRGMLILACNDIVPRLYQRIHEEWGYPDVVIGAHTERLAVVVAGRIADADGREKVLSLVQKAFPYQVVDKLASA